MSNSGGMKKNVAFWACIALGVFLNSHGRDDA